MDAETALAELGGAATTAELLKATTRRRLRTAVARGDVLRLGRRYCLPGVAEAQLAASRLGGVVSHLSAAQYHGWKLKFPPRQPTITVPRRRRRLDQDGLEVHWIDLGCDQVDSGVTTPVQTGGRLLPRLRVRRRAGRGRLRAAGRSGPASPDRGHRGRAAHRSGQAMCVAAAADVRAANPFESCLRAIADDVPGLRLVPQQWVGRIGCVDLYDAALGLVVEAESFELHSDPTTFRQDVRRYTALSGWASPSSGSPGPR